MITHIVFFKIKDPHNVKKASEVLQGLKGKIPQLRHLEVGIDILHSDRSYDIALVTKFDSLEDMKAYQTHPVHEEVSNYMVSVRESSVTVDYEGKGL
jgi:heme-degrading monooxygenase HmoA